MDKKMKMSVLEDLMKKMDGRVVDRDIKPKSKLMIHAEGDDPEKMKEEIVEKLSEMKLPDKKEMKEIKKDMDDDDDSYMNHMPYKMKKALKKSKKM